ncbi:DUF1835 domain-containing protein [Mesonia maritima]|uniref:DUF1835 domain-containing protein n=1 Tax=Mesonia maritima TaxID=1793873 RepID=A0ABU1K7N8_9FLAO|nr:DUF1835 domain-containing protein [Mesonia maritima]MDR6301616.1 hypothetical protein [Mesonia maritima]
MKKTVHITCGDSCTEKLKAFGLSNIVTWREMMCEGPTISEVGSTDFNTLRKKFLKEVYQITFKNYEENFLPELEKLSALTNDDEVLIWLDFDLFCHINMLAAIQFIKQQEKNITISFTSISSLSETKHQAISSLNDKELKQLLDLKITLTADDIDFAESMWQYYCGNNPLKLKPEASKNSTFPYLASCIRAHLQRFPNMNNGFNALELNVLKLIANNQITSQKQLLGYTLQYQGYYGYESHQWMRLIKKLKPFYHEKGSVFKLNENGELALHEKQNFYRDLQDDTRFGGVSKYDFLYNPDNLSLLKL